MDSRIKHLIDWTKEKFGLFDYFLKSYFISRKINEYQETVYTFNMEWFPTGKDVEQDGSNPEGTAVIAVNLSTRQIESAIFVKGKTYAKDGISFSEKNKESIISWLEQELGLTSGSQFYLHKEEKGNFSFILCMNGVPVYPRCEIEMKIDEQGKLIFFSIYGTIPKYEYKWDDSIPMSLEEIKPITKEHIQFIEMPIYEKERIIPVYVVENVYVSKDKIYPSPFETVGKMTVDQVITWDEPLTGSFERKEWEFLEEINADEAFSSQPSPDSRPISRDEQEKCIKVVKDFLRLVYPNESGKWKLETLHRDKGYIHAILLRHGDKRSIFNRKIVVIIDENKEEVVNYFDNRPLLSMFEKFQRYEPISVLKDEAFSMLKGRINVKPAYLYDMDEKKYVFCGKIECTYGVNGENGEVILLDGESANNDQ